MNQNGTWMFFNAFDREIEAKERCEPIGTNPTDPLPLRSLSQCGQEKVKSFCLLQSLLIGLRNL